MDGTEKIKVVFCRNPFDSTDRVIEYRDKSMTFREIYESLISNYPIEYAQIIDLDKLVENLDETPETDEVYIRIFPSGGSTTQNLGLAEGLIGAALVVGGIVLIATGAGAPLGVALIGTGVGMVLAGYVTYNTEIPNISTNKTQSTKTTYSIRGAKNQSRQGARIPILLGKHLIIPDTCAAPYVTNGYQLDASGKNYETPQFLHQMFCCGYKDITLTMGSVKIGDTPFNTRYFDMDIDVLQNTSTPSDIYPKLVRQTALSRLLEYNDAIIQTTPTKTSIIDIDLTFPSGCVHYSKDGDSESTYVHIKFEYRTNENGVTGNWKILKPSYSKLDEDYWYIGGEWKETYRQTVTITLDNLFPTDPDYCPSRQYDVRVTRKNKDHTSARYIDKIYWETMKCYPSNFIKYDPGTFPVKKEIMPYLTLIAAKIKAADNANNIIDNLNIIGQLNTYIWDGTGSGSSHWSSKAATSNPASCFLYIIRTPYINKKPATNDQIDWAAFESWYTFCDTKGFECNTYISYDITLEELLNSIVLTGRATWTIKDGKYTIIIEKEQATPIQFFTPRNSWGFTGTKVFVDAPTCLNMKYIDASAGYIEAERKVYYDDDNPSEEIMQDVQLFGVTSANHAWKIGKYQLACTYLRPEVYTFQVDVEHIVCNRGDRIKINHDVPLFGLFSGRLVEFFIVDDLLQGIALDEYVLFEPDKSYGITIRQSNGIELTKTVFNFATTSNIETKELYFTTPFTKPSNLELDNLVMFGETTKETVDLIIIDIIANDDLSATLTCVEYLESIYTSDSGEIPPYEPRIDIPGDATTAIIIGVPTDPNIGVTENSQVIGENDVRSTALTSAAVSYGILNTPNGALWPYPYDSTNLYYTDEDSYDLYIKSNNNTLIGTKIADSAFVNCKDYYINMENGYLYLLDGTQITNVAVMNPVIVNTTGTVVFVKPDDMKIYAVNSTVDTLPNSGAAVTSYSLMNTNICFLGDGELAVVDQDGIIANTGLTGLIVINATNGEYKRTILQSPSIANITQMHLLSTGMILFNIADDFNLYYTGITEESTLNLFNRNVIMFGVIDNLIYYIDNETNALYKQSNSTSVDLIDIKPIIRKTSSPNKIIGTTFLNSELITGISYADIAKLEINDKITGSTIPENSTILSIHENDIVISNKCSGSDTIEMLVDSRRIFFEANDILSDKTISPAKIDEDSFAKCNISYTLNIAQTAQTFSDFYIDTIAPSVVYSNNTSLIDSTLKRIVILADGWYNISVFGDINYTNITTPSPLDCFKDIVEISVKSAPSTPVSRTILNSLSKTSTATTASGTTSTFTHEHNIKIYLFKDDTVNVKFYGGLNTSDTSWGTTGTLFVSLDQTL